MSGTDRDRAPWSRGRWVLVVTALMGVQFLVLLGLPEAAPQPRPRAFERPAWPSFRVPRVADDGWSRHLEVWDPTVFAVPAARGLAAGAWDPALRAGGPELSWGEPARWLGARSNWFGLPAETRGVSIASAGGPVDKPAAPVTRVQAPPVPVAGGSRVVLDGALERRGLLTPWVVPVITHSNLVGSTVVQVTVEPDGGVFSAVVMEGSGLPAADERALALARSARFKPTNRSVGGAAAVERVWGVIRVCWRTVAPEPGGTP